MTESAPPAGSRVFANIVSLSSGEIGGRLVAFVTTVYIARQFGPDGFGIIGFATAVCGYISIAVSSGFDDLGARAVARKPGHAARITTGAVLVRVLVAAVAFVFTTAFVRLWSAGSATGTIIILTSLSFFSLALDSSWAYKGLERNGPVGLSIVLSQISYLVLVLALVRGPEDLIVVPLAQFAGELIKAAFLLVPLIRGGVERADIRGGFEIIAGSVYLVMTRLTRTLIYTFDIVMIGVFLTQADVGVYSAAYRICLLITAIGFSLRVSYLPSVTRAAAEGGEAVSDVTGRSVELSLAVVLPLCAGGAIVGAPLLSTVFGDAFAGGASVFALLVISVSLAFLFGPVHNVLLVYDRTGPETRVMIVGSLVNVVLNVMLIPRIGIVGAAISTVVSQLLVLVLGVRMLLPLGVRLRARGVLRIAGATALMGLTLLAIGGERSILLTLPVGAFSYALASVLLGAIPRDARHHLRWLPRHLL